MSQLNQAESFDSKIQIITKYFSEIINMSEYEISIISDMIRNLGEPIPSTKVLIENKISELISLKANLAYIKLRIKDIKRDYEIPHMNTYHTQFMILTKQGRPSTESKIAEIYALNPLMREQRDKISELDNILDFINTNVDLIDNRIKNLESRKYSL